MDTNLIVEKLREGIWVAIKLGGPTLVLSMLVGVLIAIFQAVTQIHEQTLGFILKLIVIVLVLLLGGGWTTIFVTISGGLLVLVVLALIASRGENKEKGERIKDRGERG